MGAALREAWLWVLLAFLLGLAIGYFLKQRPAGARATRASAVTDHTATGATTATGNTTTQIATLEAQRQEQHGAEHEAGSSQALAPSATKATTSGVAVLTAEAPAPVVAPAEKSTASVQAAAEPTTTAANAVAPATAPTNKPTRRKPASRRTASKAAVLDLAAAKATLGVTVKLDDLKLIEGIGPRIEALFKADGVTSWRELSKANVERLQGILDAAGPRYKVHNPGSWPRQAGLLADGKWAEFKTLTDKLKGGR
jgi:predicted flap endonuclease-1-like 5' DNA nuclease